MPRQRLIKTKYSNIYKTEDGKSHYLRKNINGKQINKKIGDKLSDKQAQKLSESLILTLLENESTQKTIYKKFKQYVKDYIKDNAHLYSNTWEYRNTNYFNKLEIFNDIKINDITTNDYRRVFTALLEAYAPKTCEDIKSSIVAMYKYYNLDASIPKGIKIPKYDNQVHFTMKEKDVKKLKKAIKTYPDIKYRAFFMFGLTGRRKNEISEMRWSWIDMDECYVHLPSWVCKNRNNATFPITPELRDTLFEMKMDADHNEDRVFLNGAGNKLYYINEKWDRMLEDNDIPHMRFHDTRHLIGFLAINKGMTLEQIGTALGHSSIETTKRYSQLRKETARKVLNSIF